MLFHMISFVSCDDLIDDDLIGLEKLVCRFNEWISNHYIISFSKLIPNDGEPADKVSEGIFTPIYLYRTLGMRKGMLLSGIHLI